MRSGQEFPSITISSGEFQKEINFQSPGYSASVLNALRAVGPNYNLKLEANKLMQMQTEVKDHPPAQASPENHKKEISEIASFCIEEVWHLIHLHLQEFKNLFFIIKKESGTRYKNVRVDETEFKERLSGTSSYKEALQMVDGYANAFIAETIKIWIEMYEEYFKRTDLNQEEVYRSKVYSRLKSLLTRGEHNIRFTEGEKIGEPVENVEGYLWGGFNGAFRITHGIHSVVPEVYFKEQGKNITKDEYLQITRDAKHLAMALANVFASYSDIFRDELSGGVNDTESSFVSDKFVLIKGKEGSLSLEIRPEVLNKILQDVVEASKLHKLKLSVGCPALYTPGKKGGNVISEFYDWQHGLVEKYLVPHLQKFNTEIEARLKS